ncbi:MAG TPA: RNA polymerase sigma factor [Vicinamibacterales bacterium]|jgi:RNA polymerase sigma-70 factor, ECF subfamily|nr:RNA polymerase sigma factor [Vicinamibacterales bacterium]
MSRTPPRRAPSTVAGAAAPLAPLSRDSQLAAEIKGLVASGDRDAARDRYGELVAHQQRRAVRIAYQYLRDAHDADEAVQDAFVKVFTHIISYREDLPFEVWFTRILVNACLDLRKSRARRLRWAVPMSSSSDTPPSDPATPEPTPEQRLVSRERADEITAAVESLPDRQRTVFTLCHVAEQTTAEVSQALGLSEATVRVHLFRAVRKLRRLLDHAS